MNSINIVNKKRRKGILGRLFLNPLILFLDALKLRGNLYHIHDPELIPWGILIKVITRAKIVYDRHEYYDQKFLDSEKYPEILKKYAQKIYKNYEKIILFFYTGIITVNDEMGENFNRINKNVLSIYNYPSKSIINHRRNVFTGKKIIYTGSMSKRKGYHTIINSMKKIREKIPDAEVIILGWLDKEFLVDKTKMKNGDIFLDDGVYLKGRVDYLDAIKIVTESDVAWIPWENTRNNFLGTPRKLFEYMASGIPVVASKFHFLDQYISENECGILCDANDPSKHAEAIIQILKNEKLQRKLGDNGRSAIKNKYNWENEELKLANFYRKILT